MITENVAKLNINKLSKKRYDRLVVDGEAASTAFYLTPELDVIQKKFADEQELGEVLIEAAKEMLDKDAYECTILLTDTSAILFDWGTAVAKMYRHGVSSSSSNWMFPTKIYSDLEVYSTRLYTYNDGMWTYNTPIREHTILSGTEAPADDEGKDGDIYIQYID